MFTTWTGTTATTLCARTTLRRRTGTAQKKVTTKRRGASRRKSSSVKFFCLKKTAELDVATGIGIEKLRSSTTSDGRSGGKVVGASTTMRRHFPPPMHYSSEYTPWKSVVGGVFLATSLVTKYLTTGEAIGVSGLHRHLRKPAFLLGLLVGTHVLLNYALNSVQNAARIGFAGLCVGVGSACAGGCTSGHALSGVARLSKRSLVAASIFVIVGMITASVFDTAGAMDVMLMIPGKRTWDLELFFEKMFYNADIIEPWVATVCYAVFVKAKTALTFVLIALPVGSIVAGLYAYYQYINGNDPWEENFERLRTIRETETPEEKKRLLDETFHVKNEEERPPPVRDIISRGAFILCALACGFFAIAAAEAESAFHTSKLLLIWLSSLAFYAIVTLVGVYGKNKRLRACTKFLAKAVSGSLFGLALCVGGMTDPAKVSAFLSVNKKTFDPSLLVFLFVALAFAIPIFAYIKGWKAWNVLEKKYQDEGLRMKRSFFGDELAQPDKPNEPFEWRILVGASIFGLGWGLAALCPGIGLFFATFIAGQTMFRTLAHALNIDADSLEELRRLLSKALGSSEDAVVKTVAYSEGDRSVIPLTNDDDVLVMYATWESEKTGRDRKARLRFYVDKSEEEEKTSSPSKEAKRMAPHGAEKK
ncbi:unnamed protein product [Bathycoccus prasinos]